MGIGRFAFTPVLPLMQQQFGLSLAAGGVGDRADAVATARDGEPRRRGSRRPDQRS